MSQASVAIYRINERTIEAVVVEHYGTRKDVCDRLGLSPEQLISIGQVYLGESGIKIHELMVGLGANANEVLAAFYLAGYVTGETDKEQDVIRRLGLR